MMKSRSILSSWKKGMIASRSMIAGSELTNFHLAYTTLNSALPSWKFRCSSSSFSYCEMMMAALLLLTQKRIRYSIRKMTEIM